MDDSDNAKRHAERRAMSGFDKFRVGDKIEHAAMGVGTVMEVYKDQVTIKYRSGSYGIYSREWFDWYSRTIRKIEGLSR